MCIVSEKKTLSIKGHLTVIKGLQREKNIEDALRHLCKFKVDYDFDQTEKILELVEGISTHKKYGVIADYVYRQLNRAKFPGVTIIPKDIKSDGFLSTEKSRYFRKKSKDVRIMVAKNIIKTKKKAMPELYAEEKKAENVQDIYQTA